MLACAKLLLALRALVIGSAHRTTNIFALGTTASSNAFGRFTVADNTLNVFAFWTRPHCTTAVLALAGTACLHTCTLGTLLILTVATANNGTTLLIATADYILARETNRLASSAREAFES